MTLPASFLTKPIAHRGLHDASQGRAENSPKAFAAALEHGYGIELDLQLSKDGQPMVFHDYDLERLTGTRGPIAQKTAAELAKITLLHDGDGVPTLADTLAQIAGRVPILIEVKDQDGQMGPDVGRLERAAAALLEDYTGDYAVMSFNPHSVGIFKDVLPNAPRGLVTCDYTADDWPTLPASVREHLRHIPDYETLDCCFISHDHTDLDRDRVAQIKAKGHPILTWTIKSAEQEAEARKIVANITFEGYMA